MMDVRRHFPAADDCVYLNTATMALGNRPAVAALKAALDEWSRGLFDWEAAEAVGEELRGGVASLLNTDAENIGLVTGASGGAATVAGQLPEAQSSRNVVVPARDYSSNFLPWLQLRDLGYEVRLVEDIDGSLPIDAFASVIDEQTDVVATSLVQSSSGFLIDLDDLKTVAAANGAWLVLDASQALGWLTIDVEGIAALFSCSHKWTLGTRGIGYLYVEPELHEGFKPITPGWKATDDPITSFYGPSLTLSSTATKLDSSWPWFNPIADIEGIRIIEEAGIKAIENHNMALIERFESHGFAIPFSAENRSAITSIELKQPETTRKALARAGILASMRAGRLRISVHLYNTTDDIDELADILR